MGFPITAQVKGLGQQIRPELPGHSSIVRQLNVSFRTLAAVVRSMGFARRLQPDQNHLEVHQTTEIVEIWAKARLSRVRKRRSSVVASDRQHLGRTSHCLGAAPCYFSAV